MSHPDELIEDLGRTFARVSSVTRGASNYELDVTSEYSPTAREVLAYLRDGEFMVLRLGMERVLVEDSPTLAPFDERLWSKNRRKNRDTLSDLLEDFQMQRLASLSIMQNLAPSDWLREMTQLEIGVVDLLWWVEHWAALDREYIVQLHRLIPR